MSLRGALEQIPETKRFCAEMFSLIQLWGLAMREYVGWYSYISNCCQSVGYLDTSMVCDGFGHYCKANCWLQNLQWKVSLAVFIVIHLAHPNQNFRLLFCYCHWLNMWFLELHGLFTTMFAYVWFLLWNWCFHYWNYWCIEYFHLSIFLIAWRHIHTYIHTYIYIYIYISK